MYTWHYTINYSVSGSRCRNSARNYNRTDYTHRACGETADHKIGSQARTFARIGMHKARNNSRVVYQLRNLVKNVSAEYSTEIIIRWKMEHYTHVKSFRLCDLSSETYNDIFLRLTCQSTWYCLNQSNNKTLINNKQNFIWVTCCPFYLNIIFSIESI